MDRYESAQDWNRSHPPGTRVRIHLRDGGTLEAETSGYAQQWGAFALVALRGLAGVWTTGVLRVVAPQAKGETPVTFAAEKLPRMGDCPHSPP